MVKFEKHIPLCLGTGSGLYTVSTISASYVEIDPITLAQIDVSKYSSGTYYYEATFKTSAATGYATLWNATGAAAVSGGQVTTTSTSTTRVRTSAVTLVGSDTYTDRIKNDGANTTTYYGGRVVIEHSGPIITATETQISLFAYTTNTTTSAGYVQPGTIGDSYFLYTAANWDGTVTIYYEATFKTSAVTAYSECQTIGGGSVSSSQVSTSSTSFVRIRSSAITLVDGNAYKSMIKNDGTNTTSFNSGRLIIQQSVVVTKSESHLPISVTTTAASATAGAYADMLGRLYYDPATWTVDTATWNAEFTALWGGVAGNGARIYDIDAAAVLTGSTASPPGSSTTRVRSSSVTVPVIAHTLRAECDSGSGTHYMAIPKLIGTLVWTNTLNIKSVAGVTLANVKKVSGIAIANIKKIATVS